MVYTVRDSLQFVRPIVGQYGATHAIGTKNFLFLVNHALNQIWNYKGYRWSWQHRKDSFTNLQDDGTGTLKLITTRPIKKIDRFFCGKMTPIDGGPNFCDCPVLPDDPCGPFSPATSPCMPCHCSGSECEGMKWTERLPNGQLCQGEYQVSSSEFPGMGGLNGRTIRVKPPNCSSLTSLWVTYYRGVKHVKTFDEILPIPDNYMTAFAYLIASAVLGRYGQYRNQEDVNFLTLARQELDSLKQEDNIFPDKVAFDKNFPFYSGQFNNVVPY